MNETRCKIKKFPAVIDFYLIFQPMGKDVNKNYFSVFFVK